MAEEKKLGPNVQLVKQEGQEDQQPMEAYGIRFKPGESVNLEERLGKQESERVIKKLAGNQYFKVDGGPDHQAEKKKRDEAEKKQSQEEQKDREEAAKDQGKDQGKAKRAEAEYKGPEQPTLENQPPPRRRPSSQE